jgi:hypothetical protein
VRKDVCPLPKGVKEADREEQHFHIQYDVHLSEKCCNKILLSLQQALKSFGAPGHGKGTFDEVGGVIKNEIHGLIKWIEYS